MPHYSDNLYTVIVDIGVKGIYKFWWLDILGSFREEVVWKYGKIFILNSGFIIIQKKLSIYSLSLLIFFFFFETYTVPKLFSKYPTAIFREMCVG